MTIKAYMVRDSDEGACVIEFAEHAATARRNGANALNISFEEVESCTRAQWADQYAPGPVPLSAYLAAGWWFDCQHCGTKFVEYGRADECDEREDDFEPIEDARHRYYCSPTCMMTDWAERRENEARKTAIIEATAMRWPQATNIRADQYHMDGWMATFQLPGIRFGVQQAVGAKTALVAQADVDEFKRLYGVQEGGAA